MKYLLLSILLLIGTTTATDYVYVCTGKYAKCYHKTEKCEGIIKCGGEIKKVTLQQAKEIGRRPCRYCYGNK